jgi:hypothetical protein
MHFRNVLDMGQIVRSVVGITRRVLYAGFD